MKAPQGEQSSSLKAALRGQSSSLKAALRGQSSSLKAPRGGQSSCADDPPRSIGGVGHGGAPLARRIVIHARAHGVVQPGLDLAINGRGEDELHNMAESSRGWLGKRGREGTGQRYGGMGGSMDRNDVAASVCILRHLGEKFGTLLCGLAECDHGNDLRKIMLQWKQNRRLTGMFCR